MRNACRRKLDARQDRSAETPRHCTVDERCRDIGCRQSRDHGKQHEPAVCNAGDRKRPQRESQQHRRYEEDGADIAANAEADVEAADPQPRRRPELDRALERAPTLGDQVVARICDAFRFRGANRGNRGRA